MNGIELSYHYTSGIRDFSDQDLRGIDLSGARLPQIVLSGATLSEAVLTGANLNDARLDNANLQRANLDGALLNRVDLSGADLSGANLARAHLHEAILRDARLEGADLRNAGLHSADLSGVDLGAIRLEGASLRQIRAPGARFQGADLRGVDLSGADLREADLRGADLRNAQLRGADLRNADLTGANLQKADLTGANLDAAILRGADLTQLRSEEDSLEDLTPVPEPEPDGAIWDLCFVCDPSDAAAAAPLLRALAAAGVRVWSDLAAGTGQAVPTRLREALAWSRAVLACRGVALEDSRPRAWALNTVRQASTASGARRLVLVDPPSAPGPRGLWSCPADGDQASCAHLVEIVRERLVPRGSEIPGDLPGGYQLVVSSALAPSPWIPRGPLGSDRFVGRTSQLARLHSLLDAQQTSRSRPSPAQIRGAAGCGKTLLAMEYALRFEAYWPGGIFWLRHGRTRAELLGQIAPTLGIASSDQDEAWIAEVIAALRQRRPYLWVVDDLPAALAGDQSLAAPTGNGHTLLTIRDLAPTSGDDRLALGALGPPDGLALLSAWRAPASVEETADAWALLEAVDFHPHAVALIGAHLAESGTSFAACRAEISQRTDASERLAADLADLLPAESAPAIARVLLLALGALPPEARDGLRAALAGPALAPPANAAALAGLDALERRALVARTGEDSEIGTLVRRAAERLAP